uniref:NADH-ubiquinone oxidoreductase chain 6 n=1 Tax=Metalimnobia quadrinotata TaxID=2719075 RepID=A0A7D6W4G3_9DIPT|nr:NADH dehydrogenase subunit 6 [Metalimnobia quadrinotata]
MLIFMSIIISFMFMNMKHPLALGITLLFQTFLICLISGSFSKTFWFSYVLFLIFLGGMLVLFIYVTALASNEMFSLSMKLIFIGSLMMILVLFLLMFIDSMLISSFLMNMEMNINTNAYNFIQENSTNLNKLYNFPTNIITLLMINYLFLTLIIIVKITNNFNGPLRSNN